MYENLVRLIERSNVPFGREGISRSAIDDVEARLGIRLPDPYKWWLAKYGGGQIGGDIVYGIDQPGIGMADIVNLARINLDHGFHGTEWLQFYNGNGEQAFFDTTDLVNGEYKVYWLEFGQEPFLYANDFADFLTRRIREIYRL